MDAAEAKEHWEFWYKWTEANCTHGYTCSKCAVLADAVCSVARSMCRIRSSGASVLWQPHDFASDHRACAAARAAVALTCPVRPVMESIAQLFGHASTLCINVGHSAKTSTGQPMRVHAPYQESALAAYLLRLRLTAANRLCATPQPHPERGMPSWHALCQARDHHGCGRCSIPMPTIWGNCAIVDSCARACCSACLRLRSGCAATECLRMVFKCCTCG